MPSHSLDPDLLVLAGSRNVGALATIKRDGRPQLSNVNFTLDPDAPGGPLVRASVVDGRAKVANLRRDPRGSLLVTTPDGWSYAVLEGSVDLSPVARDRHDATVEELVEVYRLIRGEDHPDWDDYRRAMVQDRRCVLRLRVTHVYGFDGGSR
ncbi:MAG TPA: PPOX class F420-dependent oxidoreductase [Pedococcus sp.]|jgi:PPOX class probable F420-dependent enzyme